MAGTIALSLTQRYDKTSHEPLDGGFLYTYEAGTSTPQNAYQDVDLTIPWPNPIELDSGGNVPQMFFADGYIKFRLTNSAGVTQISADYVLVVGPSSGGGGAPSVDATTIFDTGDLKARYGTGTLSGWVRANGRTIGSASSGATERANADCQELFEYLWGADVNLSVSGGRGASANADWVANKNIALPDWRGRALAFLDDMGNSAAGVLSASYYGTAATVLGAAGGAQGRTLAANQIPTHTSVNAAQAISVATASGRKMPALDSSNAWNGALTTTAVAGATFIAFANASGNVNTVTSMTGDNSISTTYTNASQQDVVTVQPTRLATIYVKL